MLHFRKECKDPVRFNSAAEHQETGLGLLVTGTSGNQCFYAFTEGKAGMSSMHGAPLFPGAIAELYHACFTSALIEH